MRSENQQNGPITGQGNSQSLEWAQMSRNIVNSNFRLTRNLWRTIHGIIDPKTDTLAGQRCYDQSTNSLVNIGDEPDFINRFFVDIVDNLHIPKSHDKG